MNCTKFITGGITCPKGFEAAGVSCGMKSQGKDLMLITAQKPCAVAAVYTKNAVKGARKIKKKDSTKSCPSFCLVRIL